MAEFYDATEVEHFAKELIEQHHTHLIEARIKYLFRAGEWNSKGRPVWGQAVKASAREKYLTGYDFIIIINLLIWGAIEEPQKKALVDHELCHCDFDDYDDMGNPKWATIGHDFEDFIAVVRRHGLWAEEVKKMAKVMEQYQEPSLLEHGLNDPNKDSNNYNSGSEREEIFRVVSGGQEN